MARRTCVPSSRRPGERGGTRPGRHEMEAILGVLKGDPGVPSRNSKPTEPSEPSEPDTDPTDAVERETADATGAGESA